jgi:hypothetical protein
MSDTGKKPRPKRDANQPLSKPRKRKGIVLKAVFAAAFVILSVWVGLYSMQIGKIPTDWTGEDVSGFWTFSKAQVDEAKSNLENVDWKRFGEKTKKLWDRVPELEKKLELKLASLRKKKKTAAPTAATAADGTPAEPVDVPPTELELGCEAMREGIRHYRNAMNSQDELKKARTLFETAQKHFEAADREASARDDEAEAQEIKGYIEDCQKYLYDCLKLEKV